MMMMKDGLGRICKVVYPASLEGEGSIRRPGCGALLPFHYTDSWRGA